MAALTLTPTERKARRADAHHLDPVVTVGADGLTEAVLREADRALAAHGLIKLRVFSDDRMARESMLATLADRLGAAPVQHIGKLLVLWRPRPDRAVTTTGEAGPAPRMVKLVRFSKSGNHRAVVRKVKVLGNQRVTAGGLVKRAKKARPLSAKKRPAAG
jgi:RNA-binding protein